MTLINPICCFEEKTFLGINFSFSSRSMISYLSYKDQPPIVRLLDQNFVSNDDVFGLFTSRITSYDL